jgi:hypothetical protein
MYSATGHQLLRKVIPLPSLHALHSRFKDIVKERHAQLSAVAHLQSLLGDFLELGESCRPAVVVGVDAVSASNMFVGVNSVAEERESFMVLPSLQPMSPHLSCRPIHVLSSETGNANEPIQGRIDEIIAWLTTAILSVLGIASDGDKCDNARQEKVFNFWNPVERREGIPAALGHIATYGQPFPISDLLHLANN